MRRDHRRERISLDLRVQRALNPNGIYVVLGGIRWQEWPTHSTTCAPATPVARSGLTCPRDYDANKNVDPHVSRRALFRALSARDGRGCRCSTAPPWRRRQQRHELVVAERD